MCMSSMLWQTSIGPTTFSRRRISEAIGFGDRHFYDEVGRPIDQRQILPMVQLPELKDDAMVVYRLWTGKHRNG